MRATKNKDAMLKKLKNIDADRDTLKREKETILSQASGLEREIDIERRESATAAKIQGKALKFLCGRLINRPFSGTRQVTLFLADVSIIFLFASRGSARRDERARASAYQSRRLNRTPIRHHEAESTDDQGSRDRNICIPRCELDRPPYKRSNQGVQVPAQYQVLDSSPTSMLCCTG